MNYLGSKSLETERLILRSTEEKDLKELWNILLLEEVSKLYLTSKIYEDWEQEKKWQYKKLSEASNKDIFRWTIELKDDNSIIGQIDIPKTDTDEIRNIGYFIDPAYQRKGYCFEAVQEILKYMFIEVGISKIETCVSENNLPSFLLIEKLGFRRKKTTRKIKYTLLEQEEICRDYTLTKSDFLKELFRKEKLYITLDIDKDPYIKHISDDNILNITGMSGSGKTTATNPYKDDENCIVIDTDELYRPKRNKNIEELYQYLISKYHKLPDIIDYFDQIYQDILDFYKDSNKMIIIDTALFSCMKDISLLKGDLIVIRTCINNCYQRCIERFKELKKDATFEEIIEYETRKKAIYKWYHGLNRFLDEVDKS